MAEIAGQLGEGQPRRFQPYPEYRESGVAWLGAIPAHWEVKPVKAALIRNDSGVWGEDFDDDGTIVLRSTEQTAEGQWRIEGPARRRLSAREAAFAKLCVGDLVVTKSSGSAHHIGKTSVVDARIAALNCCYSNFMQRLRVSAKHVPQFFWYFMNCPAAREQLVFFSSTTTGLGNLNGSILGGIHLPTAPRGEQRAIADFLDRETAKIDALVEKKERLIELLQEKRTALITRAVTRGLDPNVPVKDCGIVWLGEVPSHWEIKRLKWAIMFQRGHDLPSHEREEGDIPVISSSGASSTHSRALASAPGIVTGRYGTIGNFYLITRDYWPLNTTLYSINLRNNEPRFLRYMLESLASLFVINALKSAVPGVDRNDIHTIEAVVPTPAEQRAIATFLDRKTATINALIAKVHEAIDHLKEYRTALISAAVTGKIDVRNEAA